MLGLVWVIYLGIFSLFRGLMGAGDILCGFTKFGRAATPMLELQLLTRCNLLLEDNTIQPKLLLTFITIMIILKEMW